MDYKPTVYQKELQFYKTLSIMCCTTDDIILRDSFCTTHYAYDWWIPSSFSLFLVPSQSWERKGKREDHQGPPKKRGKKNRRGP